MAVLMTVLCALTAAWALKLLHAVWWKPKMIEKKLKEQGIHGYPYKLIYGNTDKMMELAQEKGSEPTEQPHDIVPRINPLLHDLATTHKKSFVVWYGTTPRVTIMEPDLIKEILNNKSGDFPKPKTNSFTRLFVSGLASYHGDKWAKHRKIVSPAFHTEKLKHMMPAFAVCTDEMVSKWRKLVNFMGSSEVDMSVEFQNLTGDVISRAAFGNNFEEGRLIFLLQKEQGRLFLQSQMNINIPLLTYLPTKVNKRMKHINREVGSLLTRIIKKREKFIRAGEHREDLLGLLLKSNLNQVQESNNPEAGMSMQDVIEECKLFYFAGQETTTSLLTWTMIVLSMHPEWQERAREEVFRVFGNDHTPANYDDLNRLKIVNMILLEVLRLYPSTSLIRTTNKEAKLGDLRLPAGVQLSMPLHLVHRDKEQWGNDVMEFKPERFSDEMLKETKDKASYYPFGWGPRVCVGQDFAMAESKLAMAKILHNFSFELSPNYTHAPYAAVTLRPRYGAPIILHKLPSVTTTAAVS
ncbi:cytochrome P450, family 72, subfamily A, polypeptide 15 [Hibiscus trionum]|uniref:Cytochrome P450, family 72, subfamily A, polypeptide 15 n=1 Tax=Hibiscus trionum TaxID=183268 RepID=A0A9W7IR93_HIBTR|nr:cytochrome P450, family 72, subfamily A, polypeptide 15 [Hibiscus trionum]